MTSPGPNPAASVHARLLNGAHARGEQFVLTLQRYAAERFLYRLGQSRLRDLFVLKGATLFTLWGAFYRPTRDLDLTGYGDSRPESLEAAVREICAVPCPEDCLLFDVETLRLSPIREDNHYGGFRVSMNVMLRRSRIPFQVDVGYGNAIKPPARDEEYPTLLEGHPVPNIRAYPQEAVVAEKFHALTVLEDKNSRFKDFYDLYVISSRFGFDGRLLCEAITATFMARKTELPMGYPLGLTDEFYADEGRTAMWQAYLERAMIPGVPLSFGKVGLALRAFLGPVVDSLMAGEEFEQHWQAGGGWR